VAFSGYAQTSGVVVTAPITYPTNSDEWSICDGIGGMFTIETQALTTSTNVNLALTLQPGMEYVQGGADPLPANTGSATAPMFALGDYNQGATQTFTFLLTTDCTTRDFLLGPPSEEANIIFDFTDDESQDNTQTTADAPFSPFTNSIKIPVISLTAVTNTNPTVEVGQSYNRQFDVFQSGVNASLYEFTICMTYGADLSISNRQINGNAVTLDGMGCVEINSTSAAAFGITIPISEGESFSWTEDVIITGCDDFSTEAAMTWGCGGLDCGEETLAMGATLDFQVPNISRTSNSRTIGSCIDDGAEIVHTWTLNSGKMFDPYFYISTRSSGAFDPNSVYIDLGSGAIPINSGDFQTVSQPNRDLTSCNSNPTAIQFEIPTGGGPLVGPMTITVGATLAICCPNDCEPVNTSIYGMQSDLRYQNSCGTDVNPSDYNTDQIDLNASSSDQVPSYIGDGETRTWQIDMDVVPEFGDFGSAANVCATIDLDPGLQYVTGTVSWLNPSGLDPDNVMVTETITGNATVGTELYVCFDGFYGSGSQITFDASYTCTPCSGGGVANTQMDLGVRIDDGSCVDDCVISVLCEDATTVLGDCGCGGGCTGVRPRSATIARSCTREPDNDLDGCADGTGSIDLSKVRLDRAIFGDELDFTSVADIEIDGGAPQAFFDYLYLEITFPNAHQLGSNQMVEIFDASAAATYTCTPNVFMSADSLTATYYLTTSLVNNCGTVPNSFVYEDGDQITLAGSIVNMHNPGCEINQVVIDMDWHASYVEEPADGVDRLRCDIVPLSYQQVGYTTEWFNHNQGSYGCGGTRYGMRFDFCIGGGEFVSLPFPYEIRNIYTPERLGFEVPDGLTFDQLTLQRVDNSRYLGQSSSTGDINEDITSLAFLADGFVNLNWEDYYATCDADAQDRPSGGYRFWMVAYFEGSCSSTSTIPQMYFENELDYCSPSLVDEIVRVDTTKNNATAIVIPNLSPNTSLSLAQPIDHTVDWTFNIQETEGSSAQNAWVAFISPSGGITPATLSDGGGAITPVNGIYALGTLSGSSITNYTLDATYSSCGPDSIIALVGWDCDAVPNSVLEASQGGLSCGSDSLILNLVAQDGNLQQEVITEPTGPVGACAAVTYEIEITNVADAVVYQPIHELYIPYTDGMTLVPGTEQACYPCDPSAPTYNYPIFGPTDIIALPQGVKYIWDLETLIPDFDPSTPTGFPGLTGPLNERKLRIRFDAEVTCDFIGGDFLRFKTIGNTNCGEEVITLLQNSSQVELAGTSLPYSSSMAISIGAEPLDGCADQSPITIDANIVFLGPTDGQDSLIIALPPAYQYVNAVFDPTHVSNQTPVINVIGPATGSTFTFQELRWQVSSGLAAFTNIPIQLLVEQDTSQVLCEEENIIYMRAIRSTAVTCGGSTCGASVMTGATNHVMSIEKSSFELRDFIIETSCDFTRIEVNQTELVNTGSNTINEPVEIQYYYDTDQSGDINSGDEYIGSITNTDPVAVGASVFLSGGPFLLDGPAESCQLIARAIGCSCDAPEAVISTLKTVNAGEDVIGCSSDQLQLGCGSDLTTDGFTYEWFGLNGAPVDSLSDANDPNATLSYTHLSSSDVILEYSLVTLHPSGVCVSADTISATFQGIATTTGAVLKACPSTQVMLEGPSGFFDYQWTPTTGLVDPNDPNTLVSAPVGFQTYNLTYRDTSGCDVLFVQSVQGVNCTDLELTKTVDTTAASIGEILTYRLTLNNQGPNGASFVEVTDQLPSGLTYLSTIPDDGNYNPSTGIWALPGVVFPGDTITRIIYAQVSGDEGPIFNVAEITNMTEGDLDSTPGNDDPSEDDQEGVCTSVPIALLCRETMTIRIPDEFTSYQWFKDGVAISGATADSLDVIESGTYQIQVDGGSCPYGNCCPFIVTEEPCASIGDTVWEDTNGDGVQDGGEAGIQNVKVIIYDVNTGQPLDSAFTDASGNYLFEEIASGDYYLAFDISTSTNGVEYSGTTQNAGSDDALDSDANPTSGETSIFSFDASTGNDLSVDAGFVPQADLGNFVWIDTDQDGIQDFGEPGVSGVTVSLIDISTGLAVSSTTTDGSGLYLFTDITPGDYRVDFDLSTIGGGQEYIFTTEAAGDGANDSEVNTAGTGSPFTFDPTTGDDLTHDAGIIPVANIGDTVWVDLDGDGVQDGGAEVGLEDITVILYASDGTPMDTTTTDGSGNYLFTNVSSGDYYITFDNSTNTSGQDYTLTQTGAGTASTDSDANPSNGQTATFSFLSTSGDDLTIDAGYIPVANIGDYVWVDADQDGIQDPSEDGLENVMVILYDETGMTELDTAFTDANGAYVFTGVAAGNYSVIFDPSTNLLGNEYGFTDANAGSGTNDSDANVSTGQTAAFAFDPTTGDNLSIDAGVYPVADLGNFVWLDSDRDGIQDFAEAGVQGVTVTIYDAGTNTAVTSTVTNASGLYVFENLPEDNYFIVFDASTGVGANNFVLTTANAGNGANDSDPDPVSGATSVINFDPTTGDDLTYDAGIYPTANLGNFVFVDTDGDGVQDVGESGVPGVTVVLYNDGTGLPVDTVTTDINGNYLFEDVLSGNYYMVFDPSTSTDGQDYDFTSQDQGGDDALDSDINGIGQTAVFAFDNTQPDDLTVDAGLIPVADIGDYVWIDADNDGIQDPTEAGIESVMVIIYDNSTPTPTALDTAFTDSDGEYLFEKFSAGDYFLIFDPSTTSGSQTYEFSPSGQGNGANDSEANTSGQTPDFTFDPTSGNDLTHDAGIVPVADIGDFVWVDTDGDGIQDAGELGLESVTVTLYDENGIAVTSTTTDAAGAYLFNNVPAGDYYIGFDASTATGTANDYLPSPQDAGSLDAFDSDANTGTGLTDLISFNPSSGNDLTIDAGFIPVGNIGDTVFFDDDGDGIQDVGESGVAGATVILFDNGGTPIDTLLTDTNGNYLFEDVPPGEYYVEFDASTSATSGAGNFPFAPADQGGDDTADSDADANGQTPVFTFDPESGNDLTIDAGIIPISNIGDFVWADSNGDGIQDSGEAGIDSVMVILEDNNTGLPVDTVFTDSMGGYVFPNVPLGDYFIIFDPSTSPGNQAYTGSPQGAGDGTNDSEADASGITPVFTFDPTSGDDDTHDAGFIPVADIGDYVWIDDNQDGIQDTGESGVAGVTVVLIDIDSGVPVATATTGGDGSYSFPNIPSGEYTIVFDPSTIPGGQEYGFVTPAQGDGTNDSEANADGTSPSFVFDATTGDDNTHDAGIIQVANIGDFVWVDTDGDGIQDVGESGVEDVTVILIDTDTGEAIDTLLTDVAGAFLFEDVPPGNYELVFDASTASGNYVNTTGNVGGNDSTDSDSDFFTSSTGRFSFDPLTGNNLTLDAGLVSCDLSMSASIVCIDQGCSSVANLDVVVTWDTNIPAGENIEVLVGGMTEIIDIVGGATSPYNLQFELPANGSLADTLIAQFQTSTECGVGIIYDAPEACDCGSNGLSIDGFGTGNASMNLTSIGSDFLVVSGAGMLGGRTRCRNFYDHSGSTI